MLTFIRFTKTNYDTLPRKTASKCGH